MKTIHFYKTKDFFHKFKEHPRIIGFLLMVFGVDKTHIYRGGLQPLEAGYFYKTKKFFHKFDDHPRIIGFLLMIFGAREIRIQTQSVTLIYPTQDQMEKIEAQLQSDRELVLSRSSSSRQKSEK